MSWQKHTRPCSECLRNPTSGAPKEQDRLLCGPPPPAPIITTIPHNPTGPCSLPSSFPPITSSKREAHKVGVSIPLTTYRSKAQRPTQGHRAPKRWDSWPSLTSEMNEEFPELSKHPDVFTPHFLPESSKKCLSLGSWGQVLRTSMPLARAFLASGKGRMWGKGVSGFSSWRGRGGPSRGGDYSG